jgi:hypothetical protein
MQPRTHLGLAAAGFWLPPLGYFVLISASAPPLGVRYVLPALPFAIVLAAAATAQLWQRPTLRMLVPAFGAIQLASLALALQATPLSFFNGIVCRTGETTPCLDDSNLDWGQALPQLGRFRDAEFPGVPMRVFYFGTSAPGAYVRNTSVASPDEALRPQPALYAVSQHLRMRMPKAAWPRRAEPSAVVGGVYAIYDLRGIDTSIIAPR